MVPHRLSYPATLLLIAKNESLKVQQDVIDPIHTVRFSNTEKTSEFCYLTQKRLNLNNIMLSQSKHKISIMFDSIYMKYGVIQVFKN